ncbi:hypothetical protein ACFJGV_10235 [Cnuibacter sp. UC19_7]|uniref:hypothetical protein n=1 Tax=Cnuibacter sp. UC19_7 TaxID=3350166 RepID=UPI00366AF18E
MTATGWRVPPAEEAASWRSRATAARDLRRTRGDRPPSGDRALTVYAGILALLIVGAPLVRAVVLSLSDPAVAPLLLTPEAQRGVGLILGLVAGGLVLLGGMRGPALRSAFASATLASSDVPRRQSLRGPWVTWLVVLAGALAIVLAVSAGGLWAFGAATASSWATTVLAAALYGVVASGCWLLGQRMPPQATAAVGSGVLALVLLGWVLPPLGTALPWGWAAVAWPTTASGSESLDVALVALGLAAVAVVVVAPRLLDGLRGDALVEQASRQDIARTLAVTGDVAAAGARYRALPSIARRARAIVSDCLPLAYLGRDLVGAIRTPFRLLGGLAAATISVVLVTLAASLDPAVAWAVAGPAGVLAFAGTGAVSDGFRSVAVGIGSPALFRQQTATALALHSALPVLFALVSVVLGTVAAVGLGAVGVLPVGPTALDPTTLLLSGGIALGAIAIRLVDSLRGTLPLTLLAPIPTPAGDLSIIAQLAWQADALISAFFLAASATAVTLAGPLGLLVVPAGIGVALLRAHSRARALRP